jgi:tetratricopeptide (TPR) repeat protein
MMKRVCVAAALVAAGLLLTADAGWAQSTGAVRGRVVDEKGQALPEALINLDFQGGVTRKFDTKTNKKGEFTQVGLVPGGYRITANKEGYVGTYLDTRVGLGEPMQLPDLKLVTKAAAQAAAGGEAEKANAALREMFAKANQLSSEGKSDEAIAAYNEVLAKNPQIAEAHYNIGYLKAQKKDWPAAEAAYLKALEVRPGYGEAISALARVYQDSGQAAKAPDQGGHGQPEGRQGPVQPGRLLPEFGQGRRGGGGVPEGGGGRSRQRRDLLLPRHARRGPEQDPGGHREPREVPLHEPDERAEHGYRPGTARRPQAQEVT